MPTPPGPTSPAANNVTTHGPFPLDGVIPKHATCTACGYDISGIPITQGVIPCPECGTLVAFYFPARPPMRSAKRRWRRYAFMALLNVVVALTFRNAGWLGVGLALLSLWIVSLTAHLVRRAIVRYESQS
jgi:hypothetical protein